MAEPWAAEIDVSCDLASALIARQFPALAGRSIAPLGEGWDNAAFLVDGAYVFRFPRRQIAVDLIETELKILPIIAARLPLPISASQFAGRAGDGYPWPFAGYPLVRGALLSSLRLAADAYGHLARALGTFLRALHAIDAEPLVAAGLPGDTIGRLDHAQRMPKLEARFDELRAAGLVEDPGPLLESLDSIAPAGPRAERLTVVNGDLYARHIVMGDNLQATGIIDWGDVHRGDPAIDLSAAFEVLPPPARGAFFAAYGAIDDETLRLARYRAIYHSALVAHYGHRIADADLLHIGLEGLRWSRPSTSSG